MLNCLEGVSDSVSLPNQGGEVQKLAVGGSNENETKKSPSKSKDLKVNVASGSK